MNTTLDQWEVLETVVQLGSFAAAATKMNRSQSTISYAISRLQDQFKIPLLEMRGRKAQLTEDGKALLADAEPLLAGFRALEQKAESLAAGGETRVFLSVDSIFPNERLFTALAEFSRQYPYIHPQLHKSLFISSVREFATFGADLCITGLPARELFVKPLIDIRMQAVARPDHPLNLLSRSLSRVDLLQHIAVVMEEIQGTEITQQPHSPSQRYIAVNTIESAIEAIRSGMCFGWLPVYRIREHLNSGELVPLRLPIGGERFSRLFIVSRDTLPPGREKALLASLLGADGELEVI